MEVGFEVELGSNQAEKARRADAPVEEGVVGLSVEVGFEVGLVAKSVEMEGVAAGDLLQLLELVVAETKHRRNCCQKVHLKLRRPTQTLRDELRD